MIKSDRHARILDAVATHGSIKVEDICDKLGISPATARRDLDELSQLGQLRRTRGGARTNVVSFDMPLRQKRMQHRDEKTAIAKYCLSFIEPGDAIGVSGGSTVGAIVQELAQWATERATKDGSTSEPMVTVVTNAIDVAYLLSSTPSVRVVVVGGVLNHRSLELTGPLGAEPLSRLSLDYAFLGVNGFDASGPGTVDENEGVTNRLMASRAKTPVIVADSTKFGRRSFYNLGGLDVAQMLVTDWKAPREVTHELRQRGYDVHVVTEQHSRLSEEIEDSSHDPRHGEKYDAL